MNLKNTVRCSRAALGVFLVLLGSIASMRAQSIVTAEFPPSEFTAGLAGFGSDAFRVGQTFTTTTGGPLESIAVALAPNGPLPAQVAVEFREATAGSPASTPPLTTAFIDGSLISGATLTNPNLLSAYFLGSGIVLDPNTLYAFTLRVVGQGGVFVSGSDAFISNTYDEGSYFTSSDFGMNWTEETLSDINFRVNVVPEPSTWILLSVGLGAAVFCRKVSKRQN